MSAKAKKGLILVPVDFSPHAETALLKACELADCSDMSILVLHVVHDPGDMPSYYSRIAKKKQLVRVEDIAAEMFDEFLSAVKKKYPDNKTLKKIKMMLVKGIPVTRILQVVDEVKADLVVMSSLGRTGLKYVFLGSKAEQVVRQCPVSVMIVKSEQQ